MKIVFTFLFIFSLGVVFASKNDSLLNIVLNKELSDSIRKEAEHDAVNEYAYSDPQLALKNVLIIEKTLKEEKKTNWLAEVYWKKGIIYRELNDVKKASSTLFDALDLARKIKDNLLEAKIYNSLGSMYFNQGDIDHAEEMFLKSYKICLKANDKPLIADSYINLSGIAEGRKDFKECVMYSKKALKIYLETNDRDGEAYVYTNIGRSFEATETPDSAIIYYEKALKIFEEFKNNRGISTLLINLGIQQYKKKNLKSAIDYCQRAYDLTKEMHLDQVRKTACNCLYTAYKESNSKLAIYYLEEFHIIKDSLMDEESISENAKRELQFDYRQTQISDSLERLKEDAEKKLLHDQEVEEQKIYTYVGIGIVVILSAFLFFVYRGLRQKKRANLLLEEKNGLIQKQKKDVETQKLIIEEKHKEISDSINYAERLQRSLMASKDLLDTHLSPSGNPEGSMIQNKEINKSSLGEGGGYFIYFNPKEAVSGDFYWASHLKNGQFLLTCADSTGHGVPGAMMSMMNMNSLKEAVKEGITEPNKILDRTREIIIDTLANDGSAEGGKDGMDGGLICFDFKANKITFSLANNPLWVIRPAIDSKTNQLIEFKPDKMPVGKHDNQKNPFTLHEFQLEKGDTIYLFTDGYSDQFGGEKGKKFKYSSLQKLLLEKNNLPLSTLNIELGTAFTQWKGDLEQVDDVCIIGVRI